VKRQENSFSQKIVSTFKVDLMHVDFYQQLKKYFKYLKMVLKEGISCEAELLK
jgi:hypothetical protein